MTSSFLLKEQLYVADDNTIYRCDSDLEIVLEDLQHNIKILLNWFKIISMKPNPKKFQFMILDKGSGLPVILHINNIKIRESQKVILFSLTIDNCLTFKDHIDALCRNASYKLHALRRIRKYLTPDKAKVLYNAFINSQFSYASIIWMFCRRTDYLKMEKIQYKALKIVFNSNESFEDLILHSNEVSIHQKQLRQLTTEIYKSLTDLSPEFIKPFFTVKEIPYNLMDIFKIYHWHELRTMVPVQSFSEHVTNLPCYRFP